MTDLLINEDPRVEAKFQTYPPDIAEKLRALRQLIFATAAQTESIDELTEILKWNKPSYLVHGGSTVRLDWKAKTPDNY